MTSTSTQHRTASLRERTATLLHKLALNWTAKAFPSLTPLDLLEPEILIALQHLSPQRRTPANLADRLGINIRTINAVLSRLHHQGAIQSVSPPCTPTEHGTMRALKATSIVHHLLSVLPKIKAETLEEIHQLIKKTLNERLNTPCPNRGSLCHICHYFEASAHHNKSTPNHCHLLDIPLQKKRTTCRPQSLIAIQTPLSSTKR